MSKTELWLLTGENISPKGLIILAAVFFIAMIVVVILDGFK